MLEIKHLSKIYKTKGGVETKALDDVSINFASTGLVFLLGKSGSGKSTLLNLAGGLDEPTDGEVIVMGKSSNDFTEGDFDSYRNTYVGFVFQEYNILNEFNVEDNIALALELQGKKKDKEKINQILEDVELTEFAKRKPNTLSGGQKQRIAIARALIKDPQIIMADEPTGALDSNTGKQVMETLKKLSKTRLVLVVSHDREFAELYGDRIVELKDGKVISDVSKVHSEATTVSGNIIKLGDDTITVKKGAKLTAKDIQTLQKFISEGDGDVLVSKNDSDIANFKRANRIDDEGRRESFADTPTDSVKPYDGQKATFIRSSLPASKAFKIGASGLKLKPFRLILTILLSFITFTMFGLFSTLMLYNPNKVLTKSFLNSEYDYLTVRKNYAIHVTSDYGDYVDYRLTQITPADVASFGTGAFGVYFAHIEKPDNVTVSTSSYYYIPTIYKVAVLPVGHPLRDSIMGAYPTDANGIVVSSYFAEVMKHATFYEVSDQNEIGAEKKIYSNSDLIGENISILSTAVKVTGVFDSGAIPNKYDSIKDKTNSNGYDVDAYEYEAYLSEGMHTIAFVTEEFVEAHSTDIGYFYNTMFEYFTNTFNQFKFYPPNFNDYPFYSSSMVSVYEFDTSWRTLETILVNGVTNLQGYQVIVPIYVAPSFADSDEFYNACELLYRNDESTAEERAQAKIIVANYLEQNPLKTDVYVDDALVGEAQIVGVYLPDKENWARGGFYCSQEVYDEATDGLIKHIEKTKYVLEDDATFDYVMVPIAKTEKSVSSVLARINVIDDKTDVSYGLSNTLYHSVTTVNETVDLLSTIFLWVGVGMAAFAALMLFNFISVSITGKNKEIGILRAVGARGTDVFKIFFAESGIIVGICLVLSIIGSAVAATLINAALKAQVGLEVALFVFGPLSVVLMIGVAAVVTFVATFFPVHIAARKKPVDSIRSL